MAPTTSGFPAVERVSMCIWSSLFLLSTRRRVALLLLHLESDDELAFGSLLMLQPLLLAEPPLLSIPLQCPSSRAHMCRHPGLEDQEHSCLADSSMS